MGLRSVNSLTSPTLHVRGIPSRVANLDQAIEGLRLAEAIVEATRTGQAVAMPQMVADPQS